MKTRRPPARAKNVPKFPKRDCFSTHLLQLEGERKRPEDPLEDADIPHNSKPPEEYVVHHSETLAGRGMRRRCL